jgi:hypothetical protein
VVVSVVVVSVGGGIVDDNDDTGLVDRARISL